MIINKNELQEGHNKIEVSEIRVSQPNYAGSANPPIKLEIQPLTEFKAEIKIEVVPINIADPIGKALLTHLANWDLKDVAANSSYVRGGEKEVQQILNIVNNR